jgi:hypothetical protein
MTTMMMRNISSRLRARARIAAAAGGAVVALAATPGAGSAQFEPPAGRLSVGAAVGAFSARDAAIIARDGRDTRLGAGPSFSLEVRYAALDFASLYANGTAAFTTLNRGTDIRLAATGPSDQTTITTATAGAVLTLAGLHPDFVPTLRLGGGFKGYRFDLAGAESQWRPTGDIGVGFRSGDAAPIGVSAELRYLPSSFDQARLPTRGITPQEQRQTDLLLSVGVNVRL